jgi:hypothetical protein
MGLFPAAIDKREADYTLISIRMTKTVRWSVSPSWVRLAIRGDTRRGMTSSFWKIRMAIFSVWFRFLQRLRDKRASWTSFRKAGFRGGFYRKPTLTSTDGQSTGITSG